MPVASKPAVVKAHDVMERLRLVRRRRSKSDRRLGHVELTPPGAALVRRAQREVHRREHRLTGYLTSTEKRTLAQKNMQVLLKRKDKYGEIRGYLSTARGQLELIENTFRLLADQIVTMRSPTELSGQLDELLDGVEAVRQTARETDRLLQAIER